MADKLNKLQIRAIVLDIIKSYSSENDFVSTLHSDNIKKLQNINEDRFVVEILLKELASESNIALEAIKCLIADFATLDMVESTIWELLKSKDIPDKKKEVYLQLLRLLGGKIDVPLLMECMDDFNSVVDEQTQELLQIATVNPEAQIDFLDFLFSISTTEQVQLIESLENDFKGDELASVLSPCLKINIDAIVKETVLNILANSNSYFAPKPLKEFIQNSSDDYLKRIAIKALNQLKSSGIDIDNEECINIKEKEVCKNSKFYKAYLSQVDGCGNQGLIFSRISNNGSITMFSTVINAFTGIIDCFGMSNISVADFQKVTSRFKANDLVVPISAEVAKFRLNEAENTGNQANNSTPYEFICWNIYTSDIEENPVEYDDLLVEKITDFNKEIYFDLYETETFDSWFFEYEDNLDVQKLIDFVISVAENSNDENISNINNEIENTYLKVFSNEKLDEYSKMLKNSAFIFYLNNNFHLSNITINLAHEIGKNDNKFLKDVLKRSILQHLANLVAAEEEKEENCFKTSKQQKTISNETAFKLLNKLEGLWDK